MVEVQKQQMPMLRHPAQTYAKQRSLRKLERSNKRTRSPGDMVRGIWQMFDNNWYVWSHLLHELSLYNFKRSAQTFMPLY
ncbi:hypothetical protein D3C87_1324100 [compost metagenome]